MKKIVFALAAILAFAACTSNQPVVTISASGSFNSENVAAVSLTLSEAAVTDIQVLISGTPADKLEFDKTVIIPAGSRAAGFMVKVNPEGIAEGTAVTISIQDAIGAVVGNPSSVSLTLKTYGGGNQEGDNGGGNGEEEVPDGFTKVSAWTIEVDGDPYTDEYGDWIDLKVSTNGIKYYDVEGITDADFAEYYESVEDYFQSWEDYVATQSSITEWLFSDGDYTYIGYPGAGPGKIYLAEFDANGKLTGKYNVIDVVFPEFEGGGGEIEVDATLVEGWSAVMDGEPYTDDYGDWIDLKVTTPGIKYYAAEGITDDIFEKYYDGVEDVILDWAYYVEDMLGDYSISDILFADGEESFMEYPGAGAGKIFIVEFDEEGTPTGRYGVSSATFPEYEGGGSGGGASLDDFKQEINVPETFTVNTALGASYLGLYTGTNGSQDLFSATGTGESLWHVDVFDAGGITAADVPAYAANFASEIEDYLAEWIDYCGEDFTDYFDDLHDFLAQMVLGTYEGEPLGYDVHTAGNYDVLVLTFTDDGDFSGEYNIVSVAVDGHAYSTTSVSSVKKSGTPAFAPRHHRVARSLRGVAPTRVSTGFFTRSRHHSMSKSAKKSNKICRFNF